MANRREFMRKLSGVAASASPADVSRLGQTRASCAGPRPCRTATIRTACNRSGNRAKIAQVQEKMERAQAQRISSSGCDQHHLHRGVFSLFETQQPLVVLSGVGDRMFVPGLDGLRSRRGGGENYEAYFDYPGPVNRVRWIFERVAKRGFDARTIEPRLATCSKIQRTRFAWPG